MRFVGELYKVELLKERHVHAVSHDKSHRWCVDVVKFPQAEAAGPGRSSLMYMQPRLGGGGIADCEYGGNGVVL